MENPELKNYIDSQLAGGTSPEELKKLLVHHGWAPEIVDTHLSPKVYTASPLVEVVGVETADNSPYIDDRKKRKLGIFFIVLPFASLLLVLIAYAVTQFVVSNMLSAPTPVVSPVLGEMSAGLRAPEDKRVTIGRIINVALSLIGMLSLVGMFIFIPIGIVLIARSRRTLKPGVAYDERSGKDEASVIPPELGGWNWGAAFLTFWWGIYYRVWISLLIFVPVIGQFWWVVMGIKGNEWAWQKNKWLSVEEFKKSQKKWAVWAIVIVALNVVAVIIGFALAFTGGAMFGSSTRHISGF